MPWMSVNDFKRKFGFGRVWKTARRRSGGKEDGLLYEKFHEVKAGDLRLIFEMKKRYVRLLVEPMDAVVPMGRIAAKKTISALLERLEMKAPEKSDGESVRKDALGFKVYGEVKDISGLLVTVKEAGKRHVAIYVAPNGIPHLREKEVGELVKALALFMGEKKSERKSRSKVDRI